MNRRFFLTRLGAAATAIAWPLPTKPRQRHDLRTMIDELPAAAPRRTPLRGEILSYFELSESDPMIGMPAKIGYRIFDGEEWQDMDSPAGQAVMCVLRPQEALHYVRVDDGWIRILDWPVPHASTLTNAWRDMEVMESSAGRPLTQHERSFLLAIPPVDAQAQTCA